MKKTNFILLALGLLLSIGQLSAQEGANASGSDAFSSLKWRNIGPYRGGRANAISGVPGNPNRYYAGYAGGGVWKTDDAGLIWRNISDGFFNTGSIGEIAVSEADPNVIYVGTGEHAVRGVMTTFGDGVYKSTDAGETWTHLGLERTRHISDIAIHPENPDLVYVAAQGAAHGPSQEKGVYKSEDGGKSWRKVLFVNENTGVSSLSMDYNNPRILYAATWDNRRYPWKVQSGGAGSGIWKSTDAGETWQKINNGLPDLMGKIGVSASRAQQGLVFAIIEAEKSIAGVYRSDDGGSNWKHLTSDQTLTARSWYYMEVFADPVNPEVVYVLNAPMMRSSDGGKTFKNVQIPHGDTHDLWINPQNNANMALADDGGAGITYNTGITWSSLNNQPTAQFYRVNADKRFPYWVYGGQQDNNSVMISSRNNSYGLTEKDWLDGPGCESAYIAFDPENPVKLFGGCFQGLIDVMDMRTMERKDIMAYPSLNLSTQPKDMKYRYNWNAPLVASPHDPSVIYHCAQVVLRTKDGGLSWEEISPDLTRNDEAKQREGGGPITNEGAGGENYNTIYYLIESELEAGVIYTGSDCGLVHVTRDNGATWTNITPKDLPEASIHSIEVSPHDKGTAYIAANRYKFNDMQAMAWKTTDYGKSWQPINKGIRNDDFLRVIREDKVTPGLLYGGGERGFYLSFDGGASWMHLQNNLPVVPVTDLIIRDNDLVASTQGRAFWVLDDLSPLQQSKGDFKEAVVDLYEPKSTIKYNSFKAPWLPDEIPGIGANPLDGVILDYYLSEAADSAHAAILEIIDENDNVIRSYNSRKDADYKPYPGGPPPAQVLPAKAGLNRFAWDFRTETLIDIPGAFVYGDYRGHRVAPGKYRARITFKGKQDIVEIDLVQDPRLDAAPGQWKEQQQTLTQVESLINEIHQAVLDLRKIQKQIDVLNEIFGAEAGNSDLLEAGKKLKQTIEQWEGELVQTKQKNFQDVINFPSKLNAELFALKDKLDVHDPQVTQGTKVRMGDLKEIWKEQKAAMQKIIEEDITEYNKTFRDKNIPLLVLPSKA